MSTIEWNQCRTKQLTHTSMACTWKQPGVMQKSWTMQNWYGPLNTIQLSIKDESQVWLYQLKLFKIEIGSVDWFASVGAKWGFKKKWSKFKIFIAKDLSRFCRIILKSMDSHQTFYNFLPPSWHIALHLIKSLSFLNFCHNQSFPNIRARKYVLSGINKSLIFRSQQLFS